jgi:hypothetical protein
MCKRVPSARSLKEWSSREGLACPLAFTVPQSQYKKYRSWSISENLLYIEVCFALSAGSTSSCVACLSLDLGLRTQWTLLITSPEGKESPTLSACQEGDHRGSQGGEDSDFTASPAVVSLGKMRWSAGVGRGRGGVVLREHAPSFPTPCKHGGSRAGGYADRNEERGKSVTRASMGLGR